MRSPRTAIVGGVALVAGAAVIIFTRDATLAASFGALAASVLGVVATRHAGQDRTEPKA